MENTGSEPRGFRSRARRTSAPAESARWTCIVAGKCSCFKFQNLEEIKMIKYIFAIAVLTSTMAFAKTDPAEVDINKEVRHELVMLPYLDVFDNLAYRVDGNTVTLAGQVTRLALKRDAESAVKGIAGVEKVDNQIEVLPLSSHDDRLRLTLYRAIYGYGSLNRYALPVLK